MSAERIKLPLKMGHHRPTSEMPLVIFQAVRTSIAEEPHGFVIFQGSPDPCPPPSGSALGLQAIEYRKTRTSLHTSKYAFNLSIALLPWRDGFCVGEDRTTMSLPI